MLGSQFVIIRMWSLTVPESESFSHSVMSDSVTPCTLACQAPLSMESSRKEYCSGFPFPSSGDLPDPGIKPGSPALQADSSLSQSSFVPRSHILPGRLPYLNDWIWDSVMKYGRLSFLKHTKD